jgi:flagellar motor switch protein FliG
MLNNASNVRKAAVLLRSLDADTATTLLAQLSRAEAEAVRDAIRSLGPIDPDEQADVAAEFRRVAPMVVDDGVELQLTTTAAEAGSRGVRRFGFLEQAPIDALVPCLAREHAQTIAVVLSYLRPTRAAEVLAALPSRMQAETLERLSALGESDPDSLTVLERELATWLTSQQATQNRRTRRTDTVAAILAAAQQPARHGILDNLKQHNGRLAEEIARLLPQCPSKDNTGHSLSPWEKAEVREVSGRQLLHPNPLPIGEGTAIQPAAALPAAPSLRFDDLARLGTEELSAVLQQVDANVLVLALAGSSDELVERVTGRMPRKVAKAFRRQLRQMGPTRLRDVEAAQAAVAAAATQSLHTRRHVSKVAA